MRNTQDLRLRRAQQMAGILDCRTPDGLGPFLTADEATLVVERITRSRWWRNRGYPSQVSIHEHCRFVVADGRDWYQQPDPDPNWRTMLGIVLHELAHEATPPEWRKGHSRVYARTLLSLVRRFVGRQAARGLKAQFVLNRVKHTLPRSYSPDARLKLREQGLRLQRRK